MSQEVDFEIKWSNIKVTVQDCLHMITHSYLHYLNPFEINQLIQFSNYILHITVSLKTQGRLSVIFG